MSRKKQTPLAGGAGEQGQAHHRRDSTTPSPGGKYVIAMRMLDDGPRIYKARVLDTARSAIPGIPFFVKIDVRQWPAGEPIRYGVFPGGSGSFRPGQVIDFDSPRIWPSVDAWASDMRRELTQGGAHAD